MKRLFICWCLFLSGIMVYSQEVYQDVIYLKNGEVLSGIIVEQIPGVSMKIETAEHKIFNIKMNEIERITKEKVMLSAKQQKVLKSGFEGNGALGYNKGSGDYGLDRLLINLSVGYRFYPVFFLGAGLGVRQYPDLKATLVPVYIDIRGELMDSKVSPFVSAQVGTSLNATNGLKDVGLLIAPNLGITFRLPEGAQVYLSLGYEFQQMDFYIIYGGYANVTRENNGAISFRVGFTF